MATDRQIEACHAAWEAEATRWSIEPTQALFAPWMLSDRHSVPLDAVSYTQQTFATEAEAKFALRDLVLRAVIKAYELEAELASRPTAWAYEQACKALHHWRAEAERLAR